MQRQLVQKKESYLLVRIQAHPALCLFFVIFLLLGLVCGFTISKNHFSDIGAGVLDGLVGLESATYLPSCILRSVALHAAFFCAVWLSMRIHALSFLGFAVFGLFGALFGFAFSECLFAYAASYGSCLLFSQFISGISAALGLLFTAIYSFTSRGAAKGMCTDLRGALAMIAFSALLQGIFIPYMIKSFS